MFAWAVNCIFNIAATSFQKHKWFVEAGHNLFDAFNGSRPTIYWIVGTTGYQIAGIPPINFFFLELFSVIGNQPGVNVTDIRDKFAPFLLSVLRHAHLTTHDKHFYTHLLGKPSEVKLKLGVTCKPLRPGGLGGYINVKKQM